MIGSTEKITIIAVDNFFWVSEKFTFIVKNCFQRFKFFSVSGNY